jgi:hypothetical protein
MDAALKSNLSAAQKASRDRANQSTVKTPAAQARNVSFSSYTPALIVALLKDTLDLILITSLPGIGTVLTFCFSILIFFLLMMAGSGTSYSLARKDMILAMGTIAEAVFFGLNLLPIETMTVLFIYHSDKKASKREARLQA